MIEIYRNKPIALVNGKQVKLTKTEYRVLKALCMAGGQVVDVDLLLDMVLEGYRVSSDRETIRLHISRLRNQLGFDVIETVRATGYAVKGEIEFI